MLQSVDVWTRPGVIQGGPSGRRSENRLRMRRFGTRTLSVGRAGRHANHVAVQPYALLSRARQALNVSWTSFPQRVV